MSKNKYLLIVIAITLTQNILTKFLNFLFMIKIKRNVI